MNVITTSLSIYRFFFFFNGCLLHLQLILKGTSLKFSLSHTVVLCLLQIQHWRLPNQQQKRRWWSQQSLKLWNKTAFMLMNCIVYTACITHAVLTTSIQIHLTLKVHKAKNFLVFNIEEMQIPRRNGTTKLVTETQI